MAADVMPFEEARAARRMLIKLFGTKSDDLHVVLFRLHPARSVSFKDVNAAAADAAGGSDVYVHVGLSRRPFTGGDRPQATEIDGLGGLWADVDIAHPVHKKPGLPPDQDAALAIVRAMGLPPGLVLHSGHGLQAWWPFAEVWELDTVAERHKARVYARAWALTLRERARGQGYTVDMVSDIARVLRVAGTVNAKNAEDMRPVVMLEDSTATIDLDDVDSILLDGTYEQAEREISGKPVSGDELIYGELTLNPKADPPWEKMDLLREIEPRFDQSWRRVRNKRTETWSSSEFDQSLAAFAAQANWSRQEIANLLIAHRRKHNDDLKLRQDYYGQTINKATAGREDQEVVREAVATAIALSASPPGEHSDTARADILKRLSAAIGIEITRITRSPSEPPVFGIETPKGNGSLGSISTVISNRKFREKVAELTNVIPRGFKTDQWDTIAQGLLELAEPEELGVETTVAGRAETLISLYLGSASPQHMSQMDDRSREILPISLKPFVGADGHTRIFSTGFKVWLAEVHHEQMSAQEIGTMLRAVKATPETQNFRMPGRRTTRSLWVLPTQRTGDE